ncbi:ankyrin [Thozetella sp. PMI_491]|nr:ankyrin [Thozetella sp. PMI_491]
MHILDLPPELVDNILYYSILSRVLPRALRLKLVCKTFYARFKPVLFATKVLDGFWWSDSFTARQIRRYNGVDCLFYDYLVFRCFEKTDESNESNRSVIALRNVANALFQSLRTRGERQDLTFDAILTGLCWLALGQKSKSVHHHRFSNWNQVSNNPPNLGLNLLSAATYFECLSLVKDLLDQGHDPTQESDLFPAPMCLAAWTGREDALQIMQERLPDFEESETDRGYRTFRSKIGPGSLDGAAARGDMEMVQLALYPPSRIIQSLGNDDGEEMHGQEIHGEEIHGDREMEEAERCSASMLVLGVAPGYVQANSELWNYVSKAIRNTPSPKVYSYLVSFLDHRADLNPGWKDGALGDYAGAGNVVMVQHLLDIGANPSAEYLQGGPPLTRAILGWHEDIVDLLLKYGADPNEQGKYRPGKPLTAAAVVGSMSIMRKLLDAGARVQAHGVGPCTLWYAMKREHVAMTELILSMVAVSESARRYRMNKAQAEGLESMVDILKRWTDKE